MTDRNTAWGLAAGAFDHSPRTRLVFGCGVLGRLGALARELGGARVLLVTDRGIVAAGHAGRAAKILEDAGCRVSWFDGVRENPTTLDVARAVAVAQADGVDLIVGLGGGSSMDTAKGCNFILTNGGAMRDYKGVGRARLPMLPMIAVPTTAGTGSECQSAALIAEEETHQKMACLDEKAAPRVALLDPELTVSLPRGVTAVTGVDALSHAIESAVTTRRTALSWMYSERAFELCVGALGMVLRAPGDLEARGRMLLGAALAGLAVENSMLGAAHAASNPLTARWNIVHGAAVGMMLPHVIRFNAAVPGAAAVYEALACRLPGGSGGGGVGRLVAEVERLLDEAGIPGSLIDAGVDVAGLGEAADEAARQWTAGFNPRPAAAADFAALYRAACEQRTDGRVG